MPTDDLEARARAAADLNRPKLPPRTARLDRAGAGLLEVLHPGLRARLEAAAPTREELAAARAAATAQGAPADVYIGDELTDTTPESPDRPLDGP